MSQFQLVGGSAGAGEFLGVDWASIAMVCIVTLVVTLLVVSLFSFGLRLLAVGGGTEDAPAARLAMATVGGWMLIAVSALAVVYGVYMIIPIFHP